MKKSIGLVLCTSIFLTGILTGCGGRDTDQDKKPEVSVSILDRGTVPSSEGSYQDNRWTKWINEKSGVKVNWVPIPRHESTQKINMLVAAGEAPDIICEYNGSLITTLLGQGAIQPIDEFVDKYSVSYKKYINENEDLKDYITSDGKMYAVTSRRSQDGILNHGMWIRQDWLDKLGLQLPATDEELLNVARAFRDNDPGGNGPGNTTAFSIMNWHEIFFATYQASAQWYDEDGWLTFGHLTDRYGDALKFFKMLYDENLIDHEFITDKDLSRQKQLWATGKSGILTNQWVETNNKELMQNVPEANPVPMAPITTKYGQGGLWQEAAPNMYALFSKNMKDPAAAMKLIDWMLDEGWFTIKFGEEGIHHKAIDGVPQTIDLEKNKTELDYAPEYAFVSQWQLNPEWISIMAGQDLLSQKLSKQREESMSVNSAVKFRRDILVDPQLPDVVKTINNFTPIRDEIRMKVIAGGLQYSAEWGMGEIRKEWKRLGGDEAERLMNEWYKTQK